MSSNGRNASHGIDSERQVRTGFLFLSFDTLSCSSQKPFWPIGNSQLSHIIITQTEPLSRAASIFRGALQLSAKYGASYSRDLIDAPTVDFIYSAHSIEHVDDLLAVLVQLISRLRDGGHIFIETPNIGDELIFESLTHTPHTFLLSRRTFEYLASIMGLSIIAMECTGPPWKDGFPSLQSQERADLRIFMRKDLHSRI